ncbi:MAG: hypothetical protein CMJ85_01010 [Planctomycetes bacterium]|nr:hypothetical protein [Planctomycetota bacterium]
MNGIFSRALWPLAAALLVQAAPAQQQGARTAPRLVRYCTDYLVNLQKKTRAVHMWILVPQDIPDQLGVRSLQITPKPKDLFTKNGSRYAHFEFDGSKREVPIRIEAEVELRRHDLKQHQSRRPASRRTEAITDRSAWLASERYLRHEDPSIRAAARSIKGSGHQQIVREVHRFVQRTMSPGSYDPKDRGAVQALARKKGDCTEYADLFVALCRAKRIPARVVEGYTIPWKDTPRHNWAEVWLGEHGWVSFDPFRCADGSAAFERVENIYIRLAVQRNDPKLAGYHFFRYVYFGDAIDVKHDLKVLPKRRK